ncbi:MAG TPA: NosD domain-containing protein, partial [Candidatus Bilamarchaeaceae archaeon]|nr:NosD domain-containing protein [Candidatus Bilamarchaeaceae archaeon]
MADVPRTQDELLEENGAYANDAGYYIYSANRTTLTGNTANDNSNPGFAFLFLNQSTITSNTAHSNSYGFVISGSVANNFTNNTAHSGSDYGIYILNTSYGNLLNGTFVHSQDKYVYQEPMPPQPNNFTNLTIGYNSSIGHINYAFAGFTNVSLFTNPGSLPAGTVVLRDFWVSLNDATAPQANLSANITIYVSRCSYEVLKKAGFPTTREDILTGEVYTPLYNSSCTESGSANPVTFDVEGFSGYTTRYKGCVDLYDNSTWAGRVVNVSGIYYIVQNTTLCTNTYNITPPMSLNLIKLNTSDVHLDCNGSTINGINRNGRGVFVEASRVTLMNCTIMNFDHGIYIEGTSDSYFYNNLMFNNSDFGLASVLIHSSFFINNTALNNSIDGFLLRNCRWSEFNHTGAYGNGRFGFNLTNSTLNKFYYSDARRNADYGLALTSDSRSNTFTYFTVFDQLSYAYQAVFPVFLDYNVLSGFAFGYNESVGIINYTYLYINDLDLNSEPGTETVLTDPYWVSIDPSGSGDGDEGQAVVTLYTSNCSSIIYTKSGFPTTRSEILTGSPYTPFSRECTPGTPNVIEFGVWGFSGYTTDEFLGCVNPEFASAYPDYFIDYGGQYAAINNITLCYGDYSLPSTRVIFSFNHSGLYFDCNGSNITGSITGGLFHVDRDNASIYNCSIRDYGLGIRLINTRPGFDPSWNRTYTQGSLAIFHGITGAPRVSGPIMPTGAIAGYMAAGSAVNTTTSNNSWIFAHYNLSGSHLGNYTYTLNAGDAIAYDVVYGKDDQFVAAGYMRNGSTPAESVFGMVKFYSAGGAFVVSKVQTWYQSTYGGGNESGMTEDNILYAIDTDSAGNYIVAGKELGCAPLEIGCDGVWRHYISGRYSNLNQKWKYNVSGYNESTFYDAIFDGDGNAVAVGYYKDYDSFNKEWEVFK